MLSAIHDAETATIKTLSAAFLADLEGDGEHWDEGEGHRSMETVLRIVSVLMVMLAAAAAGPPNPAMIKEDALRRSVGQMIIVGFNGISNTDPHFRRIIEDLESGIIGGVYFLPVMFSHKLTWRRWSGTCNFAIASCDWLPKCCFFVPSAHGRVGSRGLRGREPDGPVGRPPPPPRFRPGDRVRHHPPAARGSPGASKL